MSIRLDPRRANALKHLAGEAGVRPGDLVRHWVEERIDAARTGGAQAAEGAAPSGILERLDELAARVAALEGSAGASSKAAAKPTRDEEPAEQPETEPAAAEPESDEETSSPSKASRRVSAAPSERVALHDEMIAVIRERGPMTASELATVISERGRYTPPRSGKSLDAAMVSQRVSNPVYRSRFVRNEGRIGLAEE